MDDNCETATCVDPALSMGGSWVSCVFCRLAPDDESAALGLWHNVGAGRR